jgi:hypothetical protein
MESFHTKWGTNIFRKWFDGTNTAIELPLFYFAEIAERDFFQPDAAVLLFHTCCV